MKRSFAGIAILALALVVGFSGCSMILGLFGGNNNNNNNGTTTATLAESVVDELVAQLTQARSLSRSPVARGLGITTAQIASIKSEALASVNAAGLSQSTKLDQIVPAILDGVTTAVVNSSSDLSGALVVASKSVVISMGVSTRASNYTAGVTVDMAVASSTAIVLDACNTVSLASPAAIVALKAAVVSETVAAIDNAPVVKAHVSAVISSLSAKIAENEIGNQAAFSAVMTSMTSAAVSLNGADVAGFQASIAKEATDAVTTAYIADSGFAAGDFYLVVASSVASGAADANQAVSADLANTIILAVQAKDGAPSTSSFEGSVATVISETKPTAVATAQVAGGSAAAASLTITDTNVGKKLLLLSAGSTTAGVDYTWTCVQGDGPVPGNDGNNWYVTISSAGLPTGTYVYELTVKNNGGLKQAIDDVTITSNITPLDPTASLDKALHLVAAKSFDQARTTLSAVILSPPDAATLEQAKGWKAFLDLAAISVDTDTVSIMKDNFGLSSYPSTFDELVSGTWANQQWYGSKSGFVKYGTVGQAKQQAGKLWQFFVRVNTSASTSSSDPWLSLYPFSGGGNSVSTYSQVHFGGYSETGANLIRVSYSDIDSAWHIWDGSIPGSGTSGADSLLTGLSNTAFAYTQVYNLTDLTSPWGMLPAISAPTWAPSLNNYFSKSGPSYPFYIMANLIDRNTTVGLNAIIDKLLSGVFGPDLDSVIANIKALDAGVTLEIPDYLITATGASLPLSSVTGFAIMPVVTKAELSAFAAQLELVKGLFQYVTAYNFSANLAGLKVDLFAPSTAAADANLNGVPDAIEPALKTGGSLAGGIPATNLLSLRTASLMTDSKATIIAGLTDLSAAATAISGKLVNGDYNDYIPAPTIDPVSGLPGPNQQATANQVSQMIDAVTPMVDSGVTALSGGTDLSLSIPSSTGTTTVLVKPSVLFNTTNPFFSLSNLLVQDSGKIRLSLLSGTESPASGTVITGSANGTLTFTGATTFNAGQYSTAGTTAASTANDNLVKSYVGAAITVNVAHLATLYPDVGSIIPTLVTGVTSTQGMIPLQQVYWNTKWNGSTQTISWSELSFSNIRMFVWMYGYGFIP